MKQINLLLAEDDELLASLLHFRLKKAGYAITLSTNGREVKESLKKTIPDIIISDIMMPYYSGMELIDFVRNELKSKIPIIIMSSAGNEVNVLNAFKLGADDFLSKPISPSELLIRIDRQLSIL